MVRQQSEVIWIIHYTVVNRYAFDFTIKFANFKPNLFFENQPYVSYEKSKLNEWTGIVGYQICLFRCKELLHN